MALTYNSRRLRHERAMTARLTDEHRTMAQSAGRVLLRSATARNAGGEVIVPDTRRSRTAIKSAMWDQVVKPYYIGPGTDALRGSTPNSPFARTLVEGIEGAIRIQAERQIALLQKVVKDRQVLNWLTGARRIQPFTQEFGGYDPFHLWADPNGYRLSDRIWRSSIDVRTRIDRLLDYHIGAGAPAVRIAALLEDFLTPGSELIKTRTPYGSEGSFYARRLARTEITAAAGRATVNMAHANPFVGAVKWSLSLAHPRFDICDEYAKGGANGDGVYPPSEAPPYPPHPQCLCNLSLVPVGNVAEMVEQLRRDIRANNPDARGLQGAFNLDWLIAALMGGWFIESVLGEAA